MAEVSKDPRLPDIKDPGFKVQLIQILREYARFINGAIQGRIALTNAASAAPTAGLYQVGDFVRNSAPTEAGTAGNKYIVMGWICTVATTSGSPATFLPARVLTGN